MMVEDTKTYFEIKEQENTLKLLEEKTKISLQQMSDFVKERNINRIDFVGCGSSYFLSKALSFHLRRLSGDTFFSSYYTGSEVMLGLRKIPEKTLLIGLSRSGDSTETVKALELAKKEYGLFTGGITCEKGSVIDRNSDISIALDFVRQQSVVMTAGYTATAMVAVLFFRKLLGMESEKFVKAIVSQTKKILWDSEKIFSSIDLKAFNHFVFLGYDELYRVGLEGIIKMSEMALSEVDAFQTLEYRHGPKSKVREGSLITLLSTEKCYSEEKRLLKEIQNLGAKVLNIGSLEIDFAKNIIVEEMEENGNWFLKIIPIQLLGLFKAIAQNLNPDLPKNLDRVVKI